MTIKKIIPLQDQIFKIDGSFVPASFNPRVKLKTVKKRKITVKHCIFCLKNTLENMNCLTQVSV